MAHSGELPSTWSKVGQDLHANSLWILPLVALERAYEEHLYQASFTMVLWLISAYTAVKFEVLKGLFSNRERRHQLITWAMIFAGAALLMFGIFRLAAQEPAQASNEQAEALRHQLAAERQAKDALEQRLVAAEVNQQELARTKQELDRAQFRLPDGQLFPEADAQRIGLAGRLKMLIADLNGYRSQLAGLGGELIAFEKEPPAPPRLISVRRQWTLITSLAAQSIMSVYPQRTIDFRTVPELGDKLAVRVPGDADIADEEKRMKYRKQYNYVNGSVLKQLDDTIALADKNYNTVWAYVRRLPGTNTSSFPLNDLLKDVER
jgi:hypothetical protein